MSGAVKTQIPARPASNEKWGWLAILAALLVWSFSVARGEILQILTPGGIGQAGEDLSKFWPPETGAKFLNTTL
ncbi:MAG: hypothetical protein HOG04_12840, partial [Nitrospinaceae bacterium]|nr:hypothetical protein [Nitrospinaceae bacterium]